MATKLHIRVQWKMTSDIFWHFWALPSPCHTLWQNPTDPPLIMSQTLSVIQSEQSASAINNEKQQYHVTLEGDKCDYREYPLLQRIQYTKNMAKTGQTIFRICDTTYSWIQLPTSKSVTNYHNLYIPSSSSLACDVIFEWLFAVFGQYWKIQDIFIEWIMVSINPLYRFLIPTVYCYETQ